MVSQPTHKIIGSGDGTYDKSAHGGHGKGQKSLGDTAGPGRNNSTPHAAHAIARDGVEGHGTVKRGYQNDAHSMNFHGKSGEAVGNKSDHRPFNWDGELHGESSNPLGHVGSKANAMHGAATARAEHHPESTGKAHMFREGSVSGSHGFGHAPSEHCGPLRMSGHRNAHRLGSRGKS